MSRCTHNNRRKQVFAKSKYMPMCFIFIANGTLIYRNRRSFQIVEEQGGSCACFRPNFYLRQLITIFCFFQTYRIRCDFSALKMYFLNGCVFFFKLNDPLYLSLCLSHELWLQCSVAQQQTEPNFSINCQVYHQFYHQLKTKPVTPIFLNLFVSHRRRNRENQKIILLSRFCIN